MLAARSAPLRGNGRAQVTGAARRRLPARHYRCADHGILARVARLLQVEVALEIVEHLVLYEAMAVKLQATSKRPSA